jgi:hypothetical protein
MKTTIDLDDELLRLAMHVEALQRIGSVRDGAERDSAPVLPGTGSRASSIALS